MQDRLQDNSHHRFRKHAAWPDGLPNDGVFVYSALQIPTSNQLLAYLYSNTYA